MTWGTLFEWGAVLAVGCLLGYVFAEVHGADDDAHMKKLDELAKDLREDFRAELAGESPAIDVPHTNAGQSGQSGMDSKHDLGDTSARATDEG